jgi:hypothetical protein
MRENPRLHGSSGRVMGGLSGTSQLGKFPFRHATTFGFSRELHSYWSTNLGYLWRGFAVFALCPISELSSCFICEWSRVPGDGSARCWSRDQLAVVWACWCWLRCSFTFCIPHCCDSRVSIYAYESWDDVTLTSSATVVIMRISHLRLILPHQSYAVILKNVKTRLNCGQPEGCKAQAYLAEYRQKHFIPIEFSQITAKMHKGFA